MILDKQYICIYIYNSVFNCACEFLYQYLCVNAYICTATHWLIVGIHIQNGMFSKYTDKPKKGLKNRKDLKVSNMPKPQPAKAVVILLRAHHNFSLMQRPCTQAESVQENDLRQFPIWLQLFFVFACATNHPAHLWAHGNRNRALQTAKNEQDCRLFGLHMCRTLS